MSLTKAKLAKLLSAETGLNKLESKDMLEAFFEEICTHLERHESVNLSGFGKFQLLDKLQRPGRNLITGEPLVVTARRVVTFRPSQKLRKAVSCFKPKS